MSYSDVDSEDAFKAIAILARAISNLPGRGSKEVGDKLNLIIDIAEGSEIPDDLMKELHPDWFDDEEEET